MISFGISEKAIESAKEAEREASARLKKAEAALSALLKSNATRAEVEEVGAFESFHEFDSLYRKAAQVATAMRAARNGQIENEIRRAIFAHADDLDGKPTHYKRTARLVREIVAERLGVSPDEVTAYNNEHFHNFDVMVDRAQVGIFVSDSMFEADSIRSWCRPYDDGRDDLTPAKVRRLVAQRAKEEKRLRDAAEAHKERAREAVKKFACIGDTKCLKDAARVKYI